MPFGDLHPTPPRHPEAQTITGRYGPECSSCHGRLAHREQWRCPYVRCRKWFRGAAELPARKSA